MSVLDSRRSPDPPPAGLEQVRAALERSEFELRTRTQQLEEERARLLAAQSVAKVGSWHTDLATGVLTWSAETYRIFETDDAHFNQTYAAFLAHVHPEDRAAVDRALTASLEQRTPFTIEHRVLFADGRVKVVEERWLVSHDGAGRPVEAIGTCRDITAQKLAEARIRHLNRVYAVLTEIGHVIVREKDVGALLRAACRIAIEEGDFEMAWIGMPNPDGQLALAAHAGATPETLCIIDAVLQEAPVRGHVSLIRDAFINGVDMVSNDILRDPRAAATARASEWRAAALHLGYRATASLPLTVEGMTLGTLNLYAAERDAFDDDEMRLLDALASDIAFALDVHRRDAERQRAEVALRSSEARLRESMADLHDVSTRLNDVREVERARMARDIHDHLGQALTALKLDLAEVRRRLLAGDAAAVDQRLTEMATVIDGSINDVRRVAAELRPVVLDDLGFVLAIRAYLQDVERRSHLRCVLQTTLTDLPIATDRATALFRILQEALTNVIRHAAARRVEVSLAADAGTVRLVIHDDGVGIPTAAQRNPRAIGLVGMLDRARLFGGAVVVTGHPGEGTTVTAHLPLAESAA